MTNAQMLEKATKAIEEAEKPLRSSSGATGPKLQVAERWLHVSQAWRDSATAGSTTGRR